MKQFIPSGAVRISVAVFYTLLAISGVSQPVFAQQAGSGDSTPSHVFQAVQNLIAEIDILREELGVYDYPPEAELQDDRAPVHLYVKTLSFRTK